MPPDHQLPNSPWIADSTTVKFHIISCLMQTRDGSRGNEEAETSLAERTWSLRRYALRVLLLSHKGATSFEDLKTVDHHLHEKFLDSAKAAGLLDDNAYFRDSLLETAHFQALPALRSFFSCLLCYCEISNVTSV